MRAIEAHIENLDKKRLAFHQKDAKVGEKRAQLMKKREDIILEAQGINVRTVKQSENNRNKTILTE